MELLMGSLDIENDNDNGLTCDRKLIELEHCSADAIFSRYHAVKKRLLV